MKLGDDFNIGMSQFLASFHFQFHRFFVGILLKECDWLCDLYIYLFSISTNWNILNKNCIIIEKKS